MINSDTEETNFLNDTQRFVTLLYILSFLK